jgi:hypothetical protein
MMYERVGAMETKGNAPGERLNNIGALLEIANKLQVLIIEKPVISGRITVVSASWRLRTRARSDA